MVHDLLVLDHEKTFRDRGSKFYEQLIDFNSLYKNLSPCIILILL